jgi:hypothetical protein
MITEHGALFYVWHMFNPADLMENLMPYGKPTRQHFQIYVKENNVLITFTLTTFLLLLTKSQQ